MKKTKTRLKQYVDKNPIESFLNIGSGVGHSAGSDIVKGGGSDFLKQVIGLGTSEKSRQELSGDLLEGEELTLANLKQQVSDEEKAPAPDIEPWIDYKREILNAGRAAQKVNQEIERKIQEILIELKRLMQSSKELQIEFKEAAVEQRVVKPGKYHESFFEWMLSTIRLARQKVEDSGAWLAVAKNKHAKREYWAMFKKHGTSFGLSGERIVATQTG